MRSMTPLVIDFSNLLVEKVISVYERVDARRSVANVIHGGTSDIGLDDWARALYYSEKPLALSVEFIPEFRHIIASSGLVAYIKRAILALVDEHVKKHV